MPNASPFAAIEAALASSDLAQMLYHHVSAHPASLS